MSIEGNCIAIWLNKENLRSQEEAIITELNDAQGTPVDLCGYYLPDPEKASQAMRPSPLFNDAIDSLS